MTGEWLVKVDHYRGGESVIGRFQDKVEAQALCDYYNSVYQADNYYIEAWDKDKAHGFDIPVEVYQDLKKKFIDRFKK